jgi:hypothetical protein
MRQVGYLQRSNPHKQQFGIVMRYVDWLLAYCCLYRVGPPDDAQQGCSKHVEAYY